jgi:hypothetical protein
MTYIKINSGKRTSGSPEDFVFKLPHNIHRGEQYEFCYAHIPYTIHNIGSTNNKFYFDEGGGTLTATIPSGFYTSTTLLEALHTALNTAGASVFTVALDINTQRATVSAVGNFSVRMASGDSRCLSVGFDTDTSGGTTHTGENFVNIEKLQSLNLDLNDIVQVKGSNVGTTFTVPCDVNVLEVLEFKSNIADIQTVEFTSDTLQLKVRLKDDDNRTVDLNGAGWYFLLRKVEC